MSNPISRRKVTQGVAWSVPAIMAAAAAPAIAASVCQPDPNTTFVTNVYGVATGPTSGSYVSKGTFGVTADTSSTAPVPAGYSYVVTLTLTFPSADVASSVPQVTFGNADGTVSYAPSGPVAGTSPTAGATTETWTITVTLNQPLAVGASDALQWSIDPSYTPSDPTLSGYGIAIQPASQNPSGSNLVFSQNPCQSTIVNFGMARELKIRG